MKAIISIFILSLALSHATWAKENTDAGANSGVDCELSKQAKILDEQFPGGVQKPVVKGSDSSSAR